MCVWVCECECVSVCVCVCVCVCANKNSVTSGERERERGSCGKPQQHWRLWRGRPGVVLCGWQGVKIQLLTHCGVACGSGLSFYVCAGCNRGVRVGVTFTILETCCSWFSDSGANILTAWTLWRPKIWKCWLVQCWCHLRFCTNACVGVCACVRACVRAMFVLQIVCPSHCGFCCCCCCCCCFTSLERNRFRFVLSEFGWFDASFSSLSLFFFFVATVFCLFFVLFFCFCVCAFKFYLVTTGWLSLSLCSIAASLL